MKLTAIASGWYHYITGGSAIRKLMQERLEVCDGCPNKVQLSETGAFLLRAVNQAASVYQCGICNCPLSPMTADPKHHCPLSNPKW